MTVYVVHYQDQDGDTHILGVAATSKAAKALIKADQAEFPGGEAPFTYQVDAFTLKS